MAGDTLQAPWMSRWRDLVTVRRRVGCLRGSDRDPRQGGHQAQPSARPDERICALDGQNGSKSGR